MVNNTGKVFFLQCKVFSDADNKERSGATYVRWGRKTCDGNATVVYRGIIFFIAHQYKKRNIATGFLSVCPSVTL